MSLPLSSPFDDLSAQERAVLDLAIEGLTDEQIANRMNLRRSTVNSYWVRIRGKLGQMNRTELVSRALRQEAVARTAQLQAENARLTAALARETERMKALMETQVALREAWHPQALVQLPQAALVTGPPANVVFANRRAVRLYRAETDGLEGLAMRDLTTAETPERLREPCRAMLESDGPEAETHGLDEPYYARRRDGSNFRAVLHAQRYETPAGPFVVLTVREFLEEAEAVLLALRAA